jgi:hypothetical protein
MSKARGREEEKRGGNRGEERRVLAFMRESNLKPYAPPRNVLPLI